MPPLSLPTWSQKQTKHPLAKKKKERNLGRKASLEGKIVQ